VGCGATSGAPPSTCFSDCGGFLSTKRLPGPLASSDVGFDEATAVLVLLISSSRPPPSSLASLWQRPMFGTSRWSRDSDRRIGTEHEPGSRTGRRSGGPKWMLFKLDRATEMPRRAVTDLWDLSEHGSGIEPERALTQQLSIDSRTAPENNDWLAHGPGHPCDVLFEAGRTAAAIGWSRRISRVVMPAARRSPSFCCGVRARISQAVTAHIADRAPSLFGAVQIA